MKYVIVGLGVAGVAAIEAIRAVDVSRELTLIGNDPRGFYARPGFAVPISGVNINQNAIALNIDGAVGVPQPEVSGESVLPLAPSIFPEPKPVNWRVVALLARAGVTITIVIGLYKILGSSIRQPTARRHLVRRMPGQLE